VRISLHLANASRPELERIEITDGESTRVGVRAANSRRRGNFYSLTWSLGVRGLIAILLGQSCSAEEVVLYGEGGSLAAALDSALSKQPEWLCEMFGVEISGAAVARRLILRENPERKRHGPVSLWLYRKRITASDIAVYVDEILCTDLTSLAQLRDDFLAIWDRPPSGMSRKATALVVPRAKIPEEPQRATSLSIQEWVEQKSFEEAYRVLSDVTSLSRTLAQQKLKGLNHHWLTEKIAKSQVAFSVEGLERPSRLWASPAPEDVEALRRYLAARGGLRLGISTGGVGSLAIFDTMIRSYELPISINYQFANSQETVERLRQQTILEAVDGVNLSIVCAMKLFAEKQREFVGLSLMPHNSHGQVSCQHRAGLRDTEPALLFSTHSSAGLFLEKHQGSVASTFEDPIALQDAIQGDPAIRALLWWPFYEMFDRRGSMTHQRLANVWEFETTVLVLHRRFLERREMVDVLLVLIREAWLLLLEKPSLLREALLERCRDQAYMRHFCRTSGLISPMMMPANVEYQFART
jgi:hypothetical protein